MDRPALVLDLDETLVSTSLIPGDSDSIRIRIRRRVFYVRPRPGLPEFIKTLSSIFDIYFFTSSAPEYANPIIDSIAPGTPIERRFFRDSCVSFCGYPVKDLRVLARPLSRILLIDDLEGSGLMQPQNLIRVSPWQGNDPEDNVLMSQLLPVLLEVSLERDLPAAFGDSGRRFCERGLFRSSAASGGSDILSL
jgi:Dullard-like phosphatase family protein